MNTAPATTAPGGLAPGGLAVPKMGAMLDDDAVEFAITLIERSGVASDAETSLANSTGRRRSISVLSVLVGLVILAMEDRALLLISVTDLLYRRLSEHSRQALGISGDASTRVRFLARYRCVRYCFHAFCSTVDPSGLPKNHCLEPQALAKATKAMTPAETSSARDALEAVLARLVTASVSVLSEAELSGFDGSTGLDATPMPLYSRGPSKSAGRCASDPDGGWYVREGDHRDTPDPKTGRRRGKVAWALEATIATMARGPGEVPTHPNLAVGVVLDRPGADPGGTGARVLARVRSGGHPAGFLGADRAYTSALPERFHLPVRALGYSLVMDYRADALGIQANSGGAILVEGSVGDSWPGTPNGIRTRAAALKEGCDVCAWAIYAGQSGWRCA